MWIVPEHANVGEDAGSDYVLFKSSDAYAWVIFTVTFISLILFDNTVLQRFHVNMSLRWACIYTFFWTVVAAAFAVFVYAHRGYDDMILWISGYALEWTLSVDNLFVFHIVFKLYKTPDNFKHKPLFWGIAGAIMLRLVFFVVEGVMLKQFAWMYLLIGVFLIWTGVRSACFDDGDDEDPRKNRVFKWLERNVRFVNGYDASGRFFVRVPVDKATGQIVLADAPQEDSEAREVTQGTSRTVASVASQTEATPLVYSAAAWYTTPPQTPRLEEAPLQAHATLTYKWHATLLFMVVLCLELADLIFAVDSVSAIVAQIPDLFLAYTACVMAMLGLRALYFLVDDLVNAFVLLKYGVAAILVFIGVKLITKDWVHIPTILVLSLLLGTLVFSIVASVIYTYVFPSKEEEEV